MKKDQLLKAIAGARLKLSQIPFLNNGGCGVVAHEFAAQAQAMGLKVNIWFANPDSRRIIKEDMEQVLAEFKETGEMNLYRMNDFDIYCWHAVVEVRFKNGYGMLFDSNGAFYSIDRQQDMTNARVFVPTMDSVYTLGECPLPIELMEALTKSGTGWNEMFRHHTYAKTVREHIKESMALTH